MHRYANIHVALSLVLTVGCSAGSKPGFGGDQTGGAGPSAGGAPGGFAGIGGGGGLAFSSGGATGVDAATGTDGSVVSPGGTTSIDECLPSNPAGLDATATQKLMAGSGSPGGRHILNPYDGTVFPRGLIAPLLMWDGVTADVVYVHIHSKTFDYKGCLKPTGTNQLQIPQTIWDKMAAATAGSSDPYTLDLTVSSSGTATGPASETFVIAKATLKGTIYYNSYKSQLANPLAVLSGGSGAVLRLTPGKTAEAFLGQTSCTGCHSVSASGNRMVANPYPLISTSGGASYAIDVNTAPNPTPLATVPSGSFTGVYPDGSLYLSNAHPNGGTMGPRAGSTGSQGDPTAQLYETDTGVAVANTGIPSGAMTPMFSPDGMLLAFNDYAIDSGHGLAVMTFDRASRTASNYRQVFSVTDLTEYPGWPFFLPDQKGIVFAIGSAADFSGMATGLVGPIVGASSDLFILDVASGTAKILAEAMGFASDQDAASGNTYLPFGTEELHHNFYPTVSPVAAGGYFWIFFDSFRHYGNTHTGTMVRQLWGAAVDVSANGTYEADPSHPPFYLTGQEDVEGNHRAFAALEPCRADGTACTTGIDCCGGFCTNGKCNAPPAPETGPVCARTDESCANGRPCCDTSDICLGGFCGQVVR